MAIDGRSRRRESHGLGSIFSTPAAGRRQSMSRAQGRMVRGPVHQTPRQTPTAGLARQVDPVLANDLYTVLERHGVGTPQNQLKPPSNNEIAEWFEILFTIFDGPSSEKRSIIEMLDLLGYKVDSRLQRILSNKFFIANTEPNWPPVLAALAYLARMADVCEGKYAPVPHVEEGQLLTARLGIYALDDYNQEGDDNSLAEYLQLLRQENISKRQFKTKLAEDLAIKEHEKANYAVLDHDLKACANDGNQLNQYKRAIEPELSAVRRDLEAISLKLVKYKEEEAHLYGLQTQYEQKLEKDGVSRTEAQDMNDRAVVIEQDLGRARARNSELEAKCESNRAALAELRPRVRQILDIANAALVVPLALPETLEADDTIERAHELHSRLELERQDAEQRVLAAYEAGMSSRHQKEQAFGDLGRENYAVTALKAGNMRLSEETARFEREYQAMRALSTSRYAQELDQIDILRQEALREHSEMEANLETARAKSGDLSGKVFSSFAPIKSRIERKLQLVDRINNDLTPRVTLLQRVSQDLVKQAAEAQVIVGALPPVVDPMFPDPDKLLENLQAEFQKNLEAAARRL